MMNNYVNEINEILYNYDVECLIYDDCQYDEYMAESRLINEVINKNMTVEQVSVICKEVFDFYFIPNHSVEQFEDIAKEILNLYN